MKRIVVVALLALALPSVAWAGVNELENRYGTVSMSPAGIVSKGSEIVECNGIQPPRGHSFGSLSFSTGALTSGSLRSGGTFSATGSSFTAIGRCKEGEPRGVILSGSFVGTITWTLVSEVGQKLVFSLDGRIRWINHKGRKVSGTTTQTIVTTKGQLAKDIGHIQIGVMHRNI